MRTAINAVIIREDGSLLLVKKRDVWILPGGKPHKGEGHRDCLLREMSEELPNIQVELDPWRYLGAFVGKTPHKGDDLRAETYLIVTTGDITPAAEICESKWAKNPEELNLSDITQKIVKHLCSNGYLTPHVITK